MLSHTVFFTVTEVVEGPRTLGRKKPTRAEAERNFRCASTSSVRVSATLEPTQVQLLTTGTHVKASKGRTSMGGGGSIAETNVRGAVVRWAAAAAISFARCRLVHSLRWFNAVLGWTHVAAALGAGFSSVGR